MAERCTHLSDDLSPPEIRADGCEDCIEMGERDWVHLRFCQECGRVGCCDNSPRKHATAHFHAHGHAVMRSFEPGEDWFWCYQDQDLLEPEDAPPAPSYTDGREQTSG